MMISGERVGRPQGLGGDAGAKRMAALVIKGEISQFVRREAVRLHLRVFWEES